MGVDAVKGRVDAALLHKVKVFTSRLRKELHTLGAFVGWLPLDYGCPPSALAQLKQEPAARQFMSNDPLTERKPVGPDWLSYQETYKRLGPDAAFWYDRLERGVVMFNVSCGYQTTIDTRWYIARNH